MAIIAPSILSANFTNLQNEIQAIEKGGASWLHYDVMDGHFVNNISFGYSILNDISKITSLLLDVHLMISDPIQYIPHFINANANLITFHYESYENNTSKIIEAIQLIKSKNVKVGLSIKPNTDIDKIKPFLDQLDLVLIMSVEPGFGGQVFHQEAIQKIKQLKTYMNENQYHCLIEVDGGINELTAKQCKDVGCDVLVAGSYIFNSDDYQKAIQSIQ